MSRRTCSAGFSWGAGQVAEEIGEHARRLNWISREMLDYLAVIDAAPHPVLPADGSWAGAMFIIIVIGFFLAAAVIGPIVRLTAPQELPLPHDPDQPPTDPVHVDEHGAKVEDPGVFGQ